MSFAPMLTPEVGKRPHVFHHGVFTKATLDALLGSPDVATGCEVGKEIELFFTTPQTFCCDRTGKPVPRSSVLVRCVGIKDSTPTQVSFEIESKGVSMYNDMVNVSVSKLLSWCDSKQLEMFSRMGGVSTNVYLSVKGDILPPDTKETTSKTLDIKINVNGKGQKRICSCFATNAGNVSGWFMANVGLLSPGATDWKKALRWRKCIASAFGMRLFKRKEKPILPRKENDTLFVGVHTHF